MSSLFEAIRQNDFNNFVRLLKSEDVGSLRDAEGKTILHHLARRSDFEGTAAGLASLVSRKHDIRNWLVEIRVNLVELLLVQDSLKNTCMHEAISLDNWNFALAVGTTLNYAQYPDRLRRNSMGLTEYEMAIVYYGVYGRGDKLRTVFGGIDTKYVNGIGRMPILMSYPNVHGPFCVFKKVAKAVKIVHSTASDGKEMIEYISVDDKKYSTAVEEDFPSSYAKYQTANN